MDDPNKVQINQDNDLKNRKGLEDHYPPQAVPAPNPQMPMSGGLYEVGADPASGPDKTGRLEYITE